MEAGCSCNLRGEVDIEILVDDDSEVLYDDKSAEYSEDNDNRDDLNREVDEGDQFYC